MYKRQKVDGAPGEQVVTLTDEQARGILALTLSRLTGLAHDVSTPPLVLVTHHADEIPEGFTHGLVLGDRRVVAQGPIDDVLTGPVLSEAFGLALDVEHRDGRWHARARRHADGP